MFFLCTFTSFLLLLTAIYVGAEFSTVAVNRFKIEVLANEGSEPAKRLLPYVTDKHKKDRYVAACQIGITIASLVLGAVGQKQLSGVLDPAFINYFNMTPSSSKGAASIIIIIFFTGLQMVIGELIPKSIAVRYKEKVALTAIWPMLISLKLFYPFIELFNGSSDIMLKLCGFLKGNEKDGASTSELKILLKEGENEGLIKPESQESLNCALTFGERTARSIMIPRTKTTFIDLSKGRKNQALKTIKESPYTRFPAYEKNEDSIIGILHLKDVTTKLAEKGDLNEISLIDLAKLHKPVYCAPTATIDKVLNKLRKERAYMAIITDEHSGTAGILTIEDILEEIFGEIYDEFDKNTASVKKEKNGCYKVAGTVLLDDLLNKHDIDLTMPEVNSVSGLMIHLSNGIPEKEQKIPNYKHYSFRIEKKTDKVIDSVIIKAEQKAVNDNE